MRHARHAARLEDGDSLYNGSEAGISALEKAFEADPAGIMANPYVETFVQELGVSAWESSGHLGNDPGTWTAPVNTPTIGVEYQANQFCPTALAPGGNNLLDNCPLDGAYGFDVALDGQPGDTLLSSGGSTGTSTIDFSDIDASVSMTPMASSENPDSPYFKSYLEAWKLADSGDVSGIPVAPLTRALIEPTVVETKALTFTP